MKKKCGVFFRQFRDLDVYAVGFTLSVIMQVGFAGDLKQTTK